MSSPSIGVAGAPSVAGSRVDRHWIAFVAQSGGNPPYFFEQLQKSPQIILFEDGRIIWRDDRSFSEPIVQSPHTWREARVNRRRLLGFVRMANQSTFYVQRPTPEIPNERLGADEYADHLGICIDGRSRIVRIFSLAEQQRSPHASRYLKSAAALVTAQNAGIGVPWIVSKDPVQRT